MAAKGKGWTVKANLDGLNKALDKYQKRFDTDHGDLIKWMSLTTLSKIEQTTPVRTGRARAAWLPFLWAHNKPADMKSGMATGESPGKIAAAQREGLRKGKHKSKFKGAKPFAWIQNNVNYIVYLEYGVRKGAQRAIKVGKARLSSVSRRMKSGFVRRAIKAMHQEVKQKLKAKAG